MQRVWLPGIVRWALCSGQSRFSNRGVWRVAMDVGWRSSLQQNIKKKKRVRQIRNCRAWCLADKIKKKKALGGGREGKGVNGRRPALLTIVNRNFQGRARASPANERRRGRFANQEKPCFLHRHARHSKNSKKRWRSILVWQVMPDCITASSQRERDWSGHKLCAVPGTQRR